MWHFIHIVVSCQLADDIMWTHWVLTKFDQLHNTHYTSVIFMVKSIYALCVSIETAQSMLRHTTLSNISEMKQFHSFFSLCLERKTNWMLRFANISFFGYLCHSCLHRMNGNGEKRIMCSAPLTLNAHTI